MIDHLRGPYAAAGSPGATRPVHGLHEVFLEPGVTGALPVFIHAVTADRNAAQPMEIAELHHQIQPGPVRQPEVGEHKVKSPAGGGGARGGNVGNAHDLMPRTREHATNDLQGLLVILHQQQAQTRLHLVLDGRNGRALRHRGWNRPGRHRDG